MSLIAQNSQKTGHGRVETGVNLTQESLQKNDGSKSYGYFRVDSLGRSEQPLLKQMLIWDYSDEENFRMFHGVAGKQLPDKPEGAICVLNRLPTDIACAA